MATEPEVIEGDFEDVTEERHLPAVVADKGMTPIYDLGTMTDEDFDSRVAVLSRGVARIATLQRSLLTENTDWGTVPGVPKPFLFKPGAEKIALFYHLVPEFIPDVRIERPEGATVDRITVITRCLLHLQSQDGPVVGDGTGAASSWEDRYRWRQGERLCPACKQPTIIKGKAEYGGGWVCFKKKGGCGAKYDDGDPDIEGQAVGRVENDAPHDQLNTLVKMSAKRSMVDAVIRATGASGIFTQDEDAASPSEDRAGASETAAGARPAQGGHKVGDEWAVGPVGYQMKVSEDVKGIERTTEGLAVLAIVAKRGSSKHTVMVEGAMAEWAVAWMEGKDQEVAVTGTLYEHLWAEGKPTQKRIREVTKLGIKAAAGWQVFPEAGASADPPGDAGATPSSTTGASSDAPDAGTGPSTGSADGQGANDGPAATPTSAEAPKADAEPTSSESGEPDTASEPEHGTTTTSASDATMDALGIFDLARATGQAGEKVDAVGVIVSQDFAVTGSGTPFFGMRLAGDDGYEYHWAISSGAYDMVLREGPDPRQPKWPIGSRARLIGAWAGNGKIAVLTAAMLA